jgi:hypothetical protein
MISCARFIRSTRLFTVGPHETGGIAYLSASNVMLVSAVNFL